MKIKKDQGVKATIIMEFQIVFSRGIVLGPNSFIDV